MAFWNNSYVEPKRKFRWILTVNGIPYYTIKKVNRPSYEIAEAEHKFINHTFYFPGRVTYNTVSFTIVDVVAPDAAETLKQMLYAGGYALPKDERVSTQTITKFGGVSALGDVKIEMIGGGGVTTQNNVRPQGFGTAGGLQSNAPDVGFNDAGSVLESWFLHNAWVKKIEFSELDYDGDDLSEITIELRYDYAELNRADISSGVGALEQSAPREPNNDVNYAKQGIGGIPERND